jgi:hypothetical protein
LRECLLKTAEDPDNGFAPAPGRVERFRILTGPGVRIDTDLAEGDTVPAEFDSMVAKIIGYGRNREEALSRLQRALRESVIVIKGGASNKTFLLDMLSRPEVQRAELDVGWLERLAASGGHLSKQYADVALVQAAIEAYDAELAVEQSQFYASAVRGRPQVRGEIGRTVELRYRGHSYSPKVYRLGAHQYRVVLDGSRVDAHIDRLGTFERWLTCFGRRFHVVSVVEGLNYRIEVDGVSHRVDRDSGGLVHAPAPAVVVSIAVKPGDSVSIGDRLVVLEAMKMEMLVVAPFSGSVRQVMARPNVQVDTGAPLLQIEAAASDHTGSATERVVLGASFVPHSNGEAAIYSRRCGMLEELRQLMLGFDVDPTQTSPLLAEEREYCEVAGDDEEIRQGEDEILNIFVDLCSLFSSQPQMDDQIGGETPSAETYLFSYLRMIDTEVKDCRPPLSTRSVAPWLIMACGRWIVRPNWKRVCSGFTNRTSE